MKIHAIQTGIVHVKSDFLKGSVAAGGTLPFLYRLFTDKQYADLPIYTWAIEHEEGVIVVDTGSPANAPKSFITQSTYTILPEETIAAQLAGLGIRPNDVRKVILTHLHGDHVDGVSAFKDAEIYLGPDEYAYYKTSFGGTFTRRTCAIPDWFDPQPLTANRAPFGSFPYSLPITRAGDVVAVPTPGHTGGHISVIATHEGLHYFMAGDVTYTQQAMLDQHLQGPTMDAAAHPQTLKRVLDYCGLQPTIYLPAHDWESGARFMKKEAATAPVLAR
jgi:glyoxylase-like metal-dependent hydrolase (beta-lactamase superfamily II)